LKLHHPFLGETWVRRWVPPTAEAAAFGLIPEEFQIGTAQTGSTFGLTESPSG